MKQHLPGLELCPHQCGARAEILPRLGDYDEYQCPTCGPFRISRTVDTNFEGPGHFRQGADGFRWLEKGNWS
jgi:hypothetical protein